MLSINISELIWTIINFFLLYFVLKRFLFDPVCRVMDARQAKIDEGLNEEKQAQETVQANRERLAAEEADSRREANRILAQTEAEDAQRSSDRLRDARQKAVDDLSQAETDLALQNTQEESLLKERSDELSALLAARILGQE